MKLNKSEIQNLFDRLDAAAGVVEEKVELILMGSGVVIHHGMPERATIDLDFWRTTAEIKEYLKNLSKKVGIDFDPEDYRHREDPYIQWVSPGFVHMPVVETWRNSLDLVWEGNAIVIKRPPVGVLLASKLGAGRDQDMDDIRYMIAAFPNWRSEIDQWIGDFSQEQQEDIRENMIYAEIFAKSQPATKNKT